MRKFNFILIRIIIFLNFAALLYFYFMGTVKLNKHPLIQSVKGILAAFRDILEDIECFYHDDSVSNGIRGYSCKNDSELSVTDDLANWVQRQNTNTASQWISPDIIGTLEDPVALFNDKATALTIYYPNYYNSDKNDLIILYPKFTKSPLFFSFKDISIQDKKDMMFGLMNNAVKERLSSEYEIRKNFKKKFKEMENYAQELKKNRLYFVKYTLNRHYKMEILLEKVEQFIINYKTGVECLIEILKGAVEIARETQDGEIIELNDIHIDMAIKNYSKIALSDTFPVSGSGSPEHISVEERYLEELQFAIFTAYTNGSTNRNNIRLKDIAPNMRRPCTPSAIIDRIKTYKKHRTHCFKKVMDNNKSKWELIESCRPIQKLLDKEYSV